MSKRGLDPDPREAAKTDFPAEFAIYPSARHGNHCWTKRVTTSDETAGDPRLPLTRTWPVIAWVVLGLTRMRYHEPHRAVRAYALAKPDSRGWCGVLELVPLYEILCY